MTILLASTSTTRKTLLENAGLNIESHPPRVDEDTIRVSMQTAGAPPRDIADKLAETKAAKISAKNSEALVLGCDQILALGKTVISKSETLDEARELLGLLRGQRHTLYSAAVLCKDGRPVWRHIGVVRMQMREFSDAYLDGYLARNWPAVQDAVGCYHLEGEGARLFSNIQGDYFSVLGLPLMELLSYLTVTGEIEQ